MYHHDDGTAAAYDGGAGSGGAFALVPVVVTAVVEWDKANDD